MNAARGVVGGPFARVAGSAQHACSVKVVDRSEGREECFFYFSNLKFDVAIKARPTIPIIILADNGRIPKNIKTAPVKAKKSPTTN